MLYDMDMPPIPPDRSPHVFKVPPSPPADPPDIVAEVRRALADMQAQISAGTATRQSMAKALEVAAVVALGAALLDSRTAGQAAQKILDMVEPPPSTADTAMSIDGDLEILRRAGIVL